MKQAQVLTDKDCKRVMAHVSRSPFANRNRCAVQLSWLAGMRVGEIAALSVGDVLNSDGSVRSEIHLKAAQTKGNKGRTVLLNAQAQAEIAIYVRTLKAATPYDPLFRSRVNKRFSANSLCQVFLRLYDDAGLDVNRRSNGTPFWALSASNRDPLAAQGFGRRDYQDERCLSGLRCGASAARQEAQAGQDRSFGPGMTASPGCQLRFLNRQLSLPVSTMSQ